MDRDAWNAANSGLADGIKSIDYMKDAAERAMTNPADQSLFRAYDLNAPLDPAREPICSPADWESCVGEPWFGTLPPRPKAEERCFLNVSAERYFSWDFHSCS